MDIDSIKPNTYLPDGNEKYSSDVVIHSNRLTTNAEQRANNTTYLEIGKSDIARQLNQVRVKIMLSHWPGSVSISANRSGS